MDLLVLIQVVLAIRKLLTSSNLKESFHKAGKLVMNEVITGIDLSSRWYLTSDHMSTLVDCGTRRVNQH